MTDCRSQSYCCTRGTRRTMREGVIPGRRWTALPVVLVDASVSIGSLALLLLGATPIMSVSTHSNLGHILSRKSLFRNILGRIGDP